MDSIWYFLVISAILLVSFEKISNIKDGNKKKYFVLIISILLIAWLDIYSLFFLLIYSSLIILVIKKQIKIFNNLFVFVALNFLLLIFIKDYYLLFGASDIYIPLGVSYYFFRLISFVVEYTKNKKEYENIHLLDYYSYVFFFPIFLAGPIQKFKDFYIVKNKIGIQKRKKLYLYLIFIVAVKIVLIDAILFELAYHKFYDLFVNEINSYKLTYHISLFGFTAFIHAYFDLMIYTEISKTISILLGFSKQENFNKPLLASNISQFWQSWHMSLSNWTRDYVFFPTLIKTKKVWLSTYASMMAIGIWHSISLNWILWAFMHGTALNFYSWLRLTNIYRYMLNYTSIKFILRILGNIMTLYFVSLVFTIVAIHDENILKQLFKTIFKYIWIQ